MCSIELTEPSASKRRTQRGSFTVVTATTTQRASSASSTTQLTLNMDSKLKATTHLNKDIIFLMPLTFSLFCYSKKLFSS